MDYVLKPFHIKKFIRITKMSEEEMPELITPEEEPKERPEEQSDEPKEQNEGEQSDEGGNDESKQNEEEKKKEIESLRKNIAQLKIRLRHTKSKKYNPSVSERLGLQRNEIRSKLEPLEERLKELTN